MNSRFERNSTIGSTIVALIIVLLVAAVAVTVGLYVFFGGGPKVQGGSKSDSSMVLTTLKEILGNFSQMRVDYVLNSSIPSQNANASISYSIVGSPTINGTMLTEYDFRFITYGNSGSESTNSSLVYFNSQENIFLATISGNNYTGANTAYADFLLLPFSVFLNFQKYFLENASVTSSFTILGKTIENFGNLTTPVTTYQGTNIHYQGDIVQNMTVKVGQPPGKDYELTTFISIQGATSGGNSQGSVVVNLISATEAGT